MAGTLEGVLAGVPGYAGFLARRQMKDTAELQDVQKMGVLAQLQGQMAARQKAAQDQARQQAYQSGLRPDMTPEQRIAHAAMFSDPETVLRTDTSHLDRVATRDAANTNAQAARDTASANAQAAREQRLFELQQRGTQEIERIREQAAQQRITREEADRREGLMREQMARLAASLRPPTQPQPLVQIMGENNQPVWADRSQAIGQRAVVPSQITADIRRGTQQEQFVGRQYNAAAKPSRDILGAAETYRAIRNTGDTSQGAVFAAEVLQRAIRSGNARFKAEADRILGGGYRGGSIDERVANFVSQLATGSPTQKVMGDLDKLMDSVEGSAMQQIANQARFFSGQLQGNQAIVNSLGRPFVQGTHVVTPKGEYRRFPTPEAAQAAAEKWLSENQ